MNSPSEKYRNGDLRFSFFLFGCVNKAEPKLNRIIFKSIFRSSIFDFQCNVKMLNVDKILIWRKNQNVTDNEEEAVTVHQLLRSSGHNNWLEKLVTQNPVLVHIHRNNS